jgi:hypothetical protein
MIERMDSIIAGQDTLTQKLTDVTDNQQAQLLKEADKISLIQQLIDVQTGIAGKLDTVISNQGGV